MNSKFTVGFLFVLVSVTMLSGCGNQNSMDLSVSSSAPENSNLSTAAEENSSSSGTFNEAVFEQVFRDIHVADATITVPGTLKDCGSHFSAEFVLLDEKDDLLTYDLLYDGTQIGYLSYDGYAELDKKGT